MERTDILALMAGLKLYGMRAAYGEVMAAGIKRQHEPPRIVGDLLKSEIAEKQARSIRYQMTIAKLPLAKDPAGLKVLVATKPTGFRNYAERVIMRSPGSPFLWRVYYQ